MNVKTLCLAILNYGESTGYEIRKLSTDGHFSHFVDASYGSIYPALKAMEQDGWVSSREERQVGKPPRKVYSITDQGRSEFLASLSKLPQRDIFKSEFMLVCLCAELVPPHAIEQAIDKQLAYLRMELATIENALGDATMEGACWVADMGTVCIKAQIDFIENKRAELMTIAGTKLRDAPALLAAE